MDNDTPQLRGTLNKLWHGSVRQRERLRAYVQTVITNAEVESDDAVELRRLAFSDNAGDCSPCLIHHTQPDRRWRGQVSMRYVQDEAEGEQKRKFRPWHMAWLLANPDARLPEDSVLQYSHRCHHTNCVNAAHSVWETDALNKSRIGCGSGSHVVLETGQIITLCAHAPRCIVAVKPRRTLFLPREGDDAVLSQQLPSNASIASDLASTSRRVVNLLWADANHVRRSWVTGTIDALWTDVVAAPSSDRCPSLLYGDAAWACFVVRPSAMLRPRIAFDSNGRLIMRVSHYEHPSRVFTLVQSTHLFWLDHATTFNPSSELPIEEALQYSHRCHVSACVNPRHGVWEYSGANISRHSCLNASHVVFPDGRALVLCQHEPACLRPVFVNSVQINDD